MPLSGLDIVLQDWAREINERALENLTAELHNQAPIGQTFELIDSFHGPDTFEGPGGFVTTLGFSSDHAGWTDEGVAPHPIPGNPTLKFFWPDGPQGPGTYYFNSVNHPGQEGTHWFSDTVEQWPDYLQEVIDS